VAADEPRRTITGLPHVHDSMSRDSRGVKPADMDPHDMRHNAAGVASNSGTDARNRPGRRQIVGCDCRTVRLLTGRSLVQIQPPQFVGIDTLAPIAHVCVGWRKEWCRPRRLIHPPVGRLMSGGASATSIVPMCSHVSLTLSPIAGTTRKRRYTMCFFRSNVAHTTRSW
jgi:hypothetical protein